MFLADSKPYDHEAVLTSIFTPFPLIYIFVLVPLIPRPMMAGGCSFPGLLLQTSLAIITKCCSRDWLIVGTFSNIIGPLLTI